LTNHFGFEPAILTAAWPALEPAFAASPYLSMLARIDAARLMRIITSEPDAHLELLLKNTLAVGCRRDIAIAQAELRYLKSEFHLLTALCDVGMVWPLKVVTRALSLFADATLKAALQLAVGRATAWLLLHNHGKTWRSRVKLFERY
jgi:glutamate-ammonia-ligase adenylyltransferase